MSHLIKDPKVDATIKAIEVFKEMSALYSNIVNGDVLDLKDRIALILKYTSHINQQSNLDAVFDRNFESYFKMEGKEKS